MSETWVVEGADSGVRLDKFLAAESRLGDGASFQLVLPPA